MEKQSFRQTPIPFKTTDGKPMKYCVLQSDGKDKEVSRAECLAKSDKPNSPFSLRWFVDEESGLVLRLPQNEYGEKIARENMRFIWREAKRKERSRACSYKGTEKCGGWKADASGFRACDSCAQYITRTVELDKPLENEDGEKTEGLQLAADYDLEAIVEDKALLDILNNALEELTEEERTLIHAIFWEDKTERQIAFEMGFKQSKSINKRKKKIIEKLRQNPALKNFFEEF